ncbi:MAG: prepilin-type cleavage/methylation domain-containing protein [Aphanocapsa sp. GSE-SYN-MK-11-07L]|nr:prepilin-type cleavage/methylation domain-containing protein [Aphanocapsa sp. GSE-SYN-MK-11-07L]
MVKQQRRPEQGFTLTEVIVSLVMVVGFVGATMQTLMLAAIFSSRAEQYDRAFTWIQEDLELVRFRASEYEKNAFPSPKCSATSPAHGLAAGLLADLGGSPKVFGPRFIGGKDLILTRTAVYATAADPFNLLKIDYVVTPQTGGSAIATLSTEVLPNAALKCP